jgi:hypothetical protein
MNSPQSGDAAYAKEGNAPSEPAPPRILASPSRIPALASAGLA